jgi:hypothetical protein
MIHAIGIDKTDSGYNVTMQLFSPEGGGSETAVDPSKPNVTAVTGSGGTVSEAITSCYSKLGGNIFVGQNQILIFGMNTDFSDTENLFGYFLSSPEAFRNVDCAVAENTAEEILTSAIRGNNVSAEKYPQMIESAAENGRCVRTTLIDLINAVKSEDCAFILPVFSQSSDSGEQDNTSGQEGESGQSGQSTESEQLPQETLQIANGAIFLNGKYTSDITYEQMGLAAMLSGRGDYVRTNVTFGEREISKTYKVKSREVSVKSQDGEIVISIICKLSPKDTQMFDKLSDRDETNELGTTLIEEKSQNLADAISNRFSVELLNADDYLKRYYPRLYRKYGSSLYDRVRFSVDVKN